MGITKELLAATKANVERLAQASLFYLWIGGKPVPASRPRVSKFGTYYPKNYSAWRKESYKFVEDIEVPTSDRPLAVIIDVVVTKPKSTKRETPTGDVDNYAKSPLDLLNDNAWKDDSQIDFLAIAKRFAEPDEEPGFHVYWTPTS